MTYKKERIVEGQTPDASTGKETSAAVAPKKKSSKRKSIPEAYVYIQAGYNNTIVSFAEENGNVICWASAGSCGFKGTRKSTPYAGQVAAETAAGKAKGAGVERVHVFVRGAGPGREQCLRGLNAAGLSIESITDTTTTPHNGCKASRPRRV
jgi:small subunit ribosomal protein S11